MEHNTVAELPTENLGIKKKKKNRESFLIKNSNEGNRNRIQGAFPDPPGGKFTPAVLLYFFKG